MRRTSIAVAFLFSAHGVMAFGACGHGDEVSAKPDASAHDAGPGRGTMMSAVERAQPPDAGVVARDGTQPARPAQATDDADAGAAQAAPPARVEPVKPARADAKLVPWGVAVSASTSHMISAWAPTIAASGARWVRGFSQKELSSTLLALEPHELALSGIFHWRPPSATEDTFPTSDIAGWQQYITALLGESRGRVRYWEIWNEPPNFTVNKSPADYAAIVQSAYDTVKTTDPQAQLGLAAQSVNLNFLAQALDAGARDHFDYITLHPYEVLALVRQGFEGQFMSIVPTVRKLLADKNPAKKDVPVHFTELGEDIATVTPEQQADQLTKAYVMGLAQGVERIHWFEVTDGDAGRFGLVDVANVQRPSFVALAKLIEVLGEQPRYEGWTLLGERAYAFVFSSQEGPVAIAWAPPDVQIDVTFERDVGVLALGTTQASSQKTLTLTNSATLIRGISEMLLQEARANVQRPFPWGGDYTQARSVSYDAVSGAAGLHPLGPALFGTIDGSIVRNMNGQAGTGFAVDPNFNSYTPTRLQVQVEVRRNGPTPASFTLHYESSSGSKAAGEKYEIPSSDQWSIHTWEITDPQFVGMWGYHLALDSEFMGDADYSLRRITVTKL